MNTIIKSVKSQYILFLLLEGPSYMQYLSRHTHKSKVFFQGGCTDIFLRKPDVDNAD